MVTSILGSFLVCLFLSGETVENHTWYCFELSISISRLEMFHVEIHLICFLDCFDFLVPEIPFGCQESGQASKNCHLLTEIQCLGRSPYPLPFGAAVPCRGPAGVDFLFPVFVGCT